MSVVYLLFIQHSLSRPSNKNSILSSYTRKLAWLNILSATGDSLVPARVCLSNRSASGELSPSGPPCLFQRACYPGFRIKFRCGQKRLGGSSRRDGLTRLRSYEIVGSDRGTRNTTLDRGNTPAVSFFDPTAFNALV